MQSEATITFTQPGVQPPVYVVTSLSSPPWAPLELEPNQDKTTSGDLVFEKKFANVAEGSYQYKIRIGEGHWVVDESKESATDEHGNRNNVVHVKAAAPLDSPAIAKDALYRKDSTIDTSDEKPPPVPFVVVEKVQDKDQPEYGDVKSKSLSVDDSKRAADPEPDFEETKPDSPLNTETLTSPDVPLVVVEDADRKDDLHEDATDAEKHMTSSESFDDPESADAQAPLFRHESFQDSDPEPLTDTIEEESAQSSTDHISSGDVINTPSAESQDESSEDELGHGPLLSHETGIAHRARKSRKAPLLSHETGPGAEEDDDEFIEGPLLPHETGFTPQVKQVHSDHEEDEFDAAPLLPHETGFSSYKDGGEATSMGRRANYDDYDYKHGHHSDDSRDFGELDLAPTFSHEQDLLAEDHGAPLLPHERGSAADSFSGSERSFSMSPITYENPYPAFGRESDTTKEPFGGSMRPSFFRTRTSSSTLPNKLPQSDADDTNLHDPGLEMFPVGRDQILERVATIGHKLPEDETHEVPTSPQPSVLSQACSSVDLKPVRSYISLASVREDEEEDDGADIESVGSPVIMSRSGARFGRGRDTFVTSHSDDSKHLGSVPEDQSEVQGTHAVESSEASSVSKTDGAKDGSMGFTSLPDMVASRDTIVNTLTPPLTPGALEALDKENSMSILESKLRQRREPSKEADESSAPTPRSEGDKRDDPVARSTAAESPEKSSVQSWISASVGVSALVAVGALYYLAMMR